MFPLSKATEHYLGIALLLVVAYFTVVAPVLKHFENTTHGTGPVVVSAQPTPSSRTTRSVDVVGRVATDPAVSAALQQQNLQLSFEQQTISSALQRIDALGSRINGALAVGLSRPSPKQQVLTIGTTATSKLSAATPAPDDSAIKRDLKEVLNDPSTRVHTDVKTDVTVHWEDKPASPIFAAYSTDGSSGVGYTFRHTPSLNLDGLLTVTNNSMELGLGLEHPIHGTQAGVGLNASIDTHTRAPKVGVFAAIHT